MSDDIAWKLELQLADGALACIYGSDGEFGYAVRRR